jgi:aspartate carbamoyltransferase regulatory subunit
MTSYTTREEGYEMTRDVIVNCTNKNCAVYETDVEAEVAGTQQDYYFYGETKCQTCGEWISVEEEFRGEA